MATTITMPQLGETVTEGTVAQWLKQPGDSVEKYEAFVEVSTDKVNAEVPAPVSGTIRELIVKEGETVPTGAPIAIIEEVGAALRSTPTKAPVAQQAAPKPAGAPSASTQPAPSNGATRAAHDGSSEAALRGVSPAVRRLAREHHIDVSQLKGTGANGRVTADDVLAASRMGPSAAVGQALAAQAPQAQPPPQRSPSTYGAPVLGTTIPLNQARRIIAERMVESKRTAPHAWSMVEVDVTNVWKWRLRE
nr:E3 binding domain-containing protein [Candidatus Eremiobacteraeota bacterium]